MRTPSIGATLSRTPRRSCWWFPLTTATLDVSTAEYGGDSNCGWKSFFLRYLLSNVKATHMPRYRQRTCKHMQAAVMPYPSLCLFCLTGSHLEAKSQSVRSTCEPLHCCSLLVAVQRGPWSCCLLCSFKISVILTAGLMLPTSPGSPHPPSFCGPCSPWALSALDITGVTIWGTFCVRRTGC